MGYVITENGQRSKYRQSGNKILVYCNAQNRYAGTKKGYPPWWRTPERVEMAEGPGFEPGLTGPEPVVLPLDDPSATLLGPLTQWVLPSQAISAFAVMCSTAALSRAIVRSLPMISVISKIPGLAVFPVMATRAGWAILPNFNPVVSMTALKACSNSEWLKSSSFSSSATAIRPHRSP